MAIGGPRDEALIAAHKYFEECSRKIEVYENAHREDLSKNKMFKKGLDPLLDIRAALENFWDAFHALPALGVKGKEVELQNALANLDVSRRKLESLMARLSQPPMSVRKPALARTPSQANKENVASHKGISKGSAKVSVKGSAESATAATKHKKHKRKKHR